MGFIELLIIAVGLSMDAFAVSVCKGLGMHRIRMRQALLIAVFFGGFQALMPLLGYFLGTQFAPLVEPVDHWVTFVLLGAIGGKMIWDGIHEDPDEPCGCDDAAAEGAPAPDGKVGLVELTMLAVATSIDAFAVGCSLAFLNVNIALAVTVIGITTFALSLVGVGLGHRFGTRYNRAATIAGGVVLILIGLKTLLEHLGIIAW